MPPMAFCTLPFAWSPLPSDFSLESSNTLPATSDRPLEDLSRNIIVDMRQYQRRVDGERAEHLFCLGVVEAIETAFERLAIKRDNSRAGTRRVNVQVGRVFAKGYFNIRRSQPLQNIRVSIPDITYYIDIKGHFVTGMH